VHMGDHYTHLLVGQRSEPSSTNFGRILHVQTERLDEHHGWPPSTTGSVARVAAIR